MDYDVIIVGAGPTGSTAAEIIGRAGYDVLVLEEHRKVGSPVHCTGKISENAVRELDLKRVGVVNKVKGAVFFSPSSKSFRLERKDTQALILNRKIFDKWLSDKAVKSGVFLLTGARAKDVEVKPSRVSVKFDSNGVEKVATSKVVIGADGASSIIAKRLGLYSKNTQLIKIGVQRQITEIDVLDPKLVELYFGRKYAHGFFAWIVPTGDDSVRVGLGLNPMLGKYAFKYLDKFIKRHPIASLKLVGGSLRIVSTHVIPTGGTLSRTICDGVIIVGDAAGQIKSTTGGGLYYGMISAKMAAQTICEALENSFKGVVTVEMLFKYEKLWREKLFKEIKFSVRARRFLDALSDKEFSYLFEAIMQDKTILKGVIDKGDIDWQSRSKTALRPLLKVLLRRPIILWKMMTALF